MQIVKYIPKTVNGVTTSTNQGTLNIDNEFILIKEGKWRVKIIQRRLNVTVQQNFQRCGTLLRNNTDTWILAKEGNF